VIFLYYWDVCTRLDSTVHEVVVAQWKDVARHVYVYPEVID
jgi:hypothetical protein